MVLNSAKVVALLSKAQQEELYAAFHKFDSDGSGSIEMGELAAFGKAIDAGWTREACGASHVPSKASCRTERRSAMAGESTVRAVRCRWAA